MTEHKLVNVLIDCDMCLCVMTMSEEKARYNEDVKLICPSNIPMHFHGVYVEFNNIVFRIHNQYVGEGRIIQHNSKRDLDIMGDLDGIIKTTGTDLMFDDHPITDDEVPLIKYVTQHVILYKDGTVRPSSVWIRSMADKISKMKNITCVSDFGVGCFMITSHNEVLALPYAGDDIRPYEPGFEVPDDDVIVHVCTYDCYTQWLTKNGVLHLVNINPSSTDISYIKCDTGMCNPEEIDWCIEGTLIRSDTRVAVIDVYQAIKSNSSRCNVRYVDNILSVGGLNVAVEF